jgi:hypothetical protein
VTRKLRDLELYLVLIATHSCRIEYNQISIMHDELPYNPTYPGILFAGIQLCFQVPVTYESYFQNIKIKESVISQLMYVKNCLRGAWLS